MKITQEIDGKDQVVEVSDDTAAFMVDRGYAKHYTEDTGSTSTSRKAGSQKPSGTQEDVTSATSGTSPTSGSTTVSRTKA